MTGTARYLIIGNSAAGVYAIEAIREVDPKGTIVLVSEEPETNYSRPLISYYLGGSVPRERMPFRDAAFYKDRKVELLLKTRVEKLDPKTRTVTLSKGRKLRYEKLLLATGGKPIVPPIKGYDPAMPGVFTFTRLEDAEAMLAHIRAHKIREAVVLGAGLIGIKATEGLLARGIKVQVVELADRILANTLDRDASELLEAALRHEGCVMRKGNSIVRITGDRTGVQEVTCKDGTAIKTRMLVLAIGVRPNTDLIEATSIKKDRGILVDRAMRTNDPRVWAAGDCAQGFDLLAASDAVIAIWPVAARQGRVAGLNMAGHAEQYRGLFAMNAVQMMDLPAISFGLTHLPEQKGVEVLVKKDAASRIYKKVVLKDGRVVGVILINGIDRAGIYGMLIRQRVDVTAFKNELLNDDFGLLVLPKEFRSNRVTGDGIEV